jgi:hypothetical protein
VTGGATAGAGAVFTGQGTGPGVYIEGGATASGLKASSGASSTDKAGIEAVGVGTTARGINASGVLAGIYGTASAGGGFYGVATAGNGSGMVLTGQGSGTGLTANIAGNITGTLSTVTTLTNLPAITAGWLTATGIAASALNGKGDWSTLTAANVWQTDISGYATAGQAGTYLKGAGSAGDPWVTSIPGAYGAGTAGYILGTNLNATVSSRSTLAAGAKMDLADSLNATGVADLKTKLGTIPASGNWSTLDAAGVRTAVGLASANLDTQLSTINGYVDCLPATWVIPGTGTSTLSTGDIDARLAAWGKTGFSLLATGADLIGKTSTFATSIADAVLARDVSNAEPTTDEHTLRFVVLQQTESSTVTHAGKLTVFQTDGTTEVTQKTLTSDVAAEPITGVS